MAAMLREIRQNDVETARMLGLYEPDRVDVNVSQSASAIVADARHRLLAVVDAEVVEQKELGA